MQTIKKTPERMIIRTNMGYSLANAIRRSVEEISTLAIDEVEIFRNDSALYDEFLAHRFGLIPLKTDGKMGEKTKVEFKLKNVGPGTVYSGDLKGGAKIMYEGIPLTLLEKGHELELVATARLGKGTDHAKHVPGLCHYRYLTEIKSSPQIDKLVKEANSVISPEKKGSFWICDLPEATIDEIEKLDKSAVKDSSEILFFIESWGHLEAETILTKAIDILKKNLKEFEKLIK